MTVSSTDAFADGDDLDVVPEAWSIDQMAQSLVGRLRAIESAAREHGAAVEAATSRRADLALAQAELDAELIRLYARRDSHALLADARRQVGEPADEEQTRAADLDRLGRTVLRGVEALEEHLRGVTSLTARRAER